MRRRLGGIDGLRLRGYRAAVFQMTGATLLALVVVVALLAWEIHHMSAQLDTLTAQVASNKSVIDSALVLIQGLAQKIIDAKNDPVALQALADSMKATDDTLAAAVAANTPAAP